MSFLAKLGSALLLAITSVFALHTNVIPPSVTTINSAVNIQVTSLSQNSGPIGATVTITGSGFAADSIVHFGTGAIQGVTINTDGTKLTFTIPSAMGPYCKAQQACPTDAVLVTPNTYTLTVEDSKGVSNKKQFTVTSATGAAS